MPPKQKNALPQSKEADQQDYSAEFCYQLKPRTNFFDLDETRITALLRLLEKIQLTADSILFLSRAATNQEDAAGLLALLICITPEQCSTFLKDRSIPWLVLLSSVVSRGQAFLCRNRQEAAYQTLYQTIQQLLDKKLANITRPEQATKLFDKVCDDYLFKFLFDTTLSKKIFALIEQYHLHEELAELLGTALFQFGYRNNNPYLLRYALTHRLFPEDAVNQLPIFGTQHAPLALFGLATHPQHATVLKEKLSAVNKETATTPTAHEALTIWALLQQLYPIPEQRSEELSSTMTDLAARVARVSFEELLKERVSNLPLTIWLQNQATVCATLQQAANTTALLLTHTNTDEESIQFLEVCCTLNLVTPKKFITYIELKFIVATKDLPAKKITGLIVHPHLKLLLCLLKNSSYKLDDAEYFLNLLLLAVLTNQSEEVNQLSLRAPDLFQKIIHAPLRKPVYRINLMLQENHYLKLLYKTKPLNAAYCFIEHARLNKTTPRLSAIH